MALDLKNILDKVGGDDGFDIKELAEKAVETIKGDDNLLESFKTNPIKVVEKVLKVDLPDDILEKIVAATARPADSPDRPRRLRRFFPERWR